VLPSGAAKPQQETVFPNASTPNMMSVPNDAPVSRRSKSSLRDASPTKPPSKIGTVQQGKTEAFTERANKRLMQAHLNFQTHLWASGERSVGGQWTAVARVRSGNTDDKTKLQFFEGERVTVLHQIRDDIWMCQSQDGKQKGSVAIGEFDVVR
jgi:hypothetical protein